MHTSKHLQTYTTRYQTKEEKKTKTTLRSNFRQVKGLVFSFCLNIVCNSTKHFMAGATTLYSTCCSLSDFFPLDPASYLQILKGLLMFPSYKMMSGLQQTSIFLKNARHSSAILPIINLGQSFTASWLHYTTVLQNYFPKRMPSC